LSDRKLLGHPGARPESSDRRLPSPFVVTPDGSQVIPIPEGAEGPVPTANGQGVQYNGGAGGNGLADNVTDVRIMDPTDDYPNGYVNYGNRQADGGWQTVDPYTGQPVSPSSPSWHIPLAPPPP